MIDGYPFQVILPLPDSKKLTPFRGSWPTVQRSSPSELPSARPQLTLPDNRHIASYQIKLLGERGRRTGGNNLESYPAETRTRDLLVTDPVLYGVSRIAAADAG